MPLKRYLTFQFMQYYPNGGWSDFTGSYDTIEEAKNTHPDQIVDITTGKIVS